MFHSPLFLVFLLPLVFGLDSTEIGEKAEEKLEQVVDKTEDFVDGVKDKAEGAFGGAFGKLTDLGNGVKETLENPGEKFANTSITEANNLKNELGSCVDAQLGKIEFSIAEAWDAVDEMFVEVMDVPAVIFKNLISEGINVVRKPIDDLIEELTIAVAKVQREVDKANLQKQLTLPTLPPMPEITVPTITLPPVPTLPPVEIPVVTLPPVPTLPPIKFPCIWGCGK